MIVCIYKVGIWVSEFVLSWVNSFIFTGCVDYLRNALQMPASRQCTIKEEFIGDSRYVSYVNLIAYG